MAFINGSRISLLIVSGCSGASGAPGGRFGVWVHMIGFTGMRSQKQRYLVDCMLIVFTSAADIADPGGEIGYGDQFIHEPGKIGDARGLHVTRLANGAKMVTGFG